MKRALRIVLGLLALVLVVVAGLLAVNIAPDKPVSELLARWAPPPSQFIAIDGLQVHLRDEGPRDDPQPILLLHGTSASLHTWQGWVEALAPKRRVIRLDLPGFGLTGPFTSDDYSMPHYVRFMQHVLDALHLSQVVVAGNSFGGNIAWHLALAEPRRVSRLILVDAGGYPYTPKSMPIGFRIAQKPWLSWVAEYVLPRSTIESSVRNVYGDPSKVTPELVERYYELTLRAGNRHAVMERFRQVRAPDSASIAKLTLPTLIVWGASDKLNPPENAARFQHDIANSQLAVLPGLGHVPHEEDPAATLKPVQAFLQTR